MTAWTCRPWVPPAAWGVALTLQQQASTPAVVARLFDAPSLEAVWAKFAAVDHRLSGDAWASLLGGFTVPLTMGYGSAGKADQPSRKMTIRQRQQVADQLMERAAIDGARLLGVLRQLQATTPFLPDQLVGSASLEHLEVLVAALAKHPRTDALFDEVPGMASQKSSWRDWLREAATNLRDFEPRRGFEIGLTLADWTNLTHVLVAPDASSGDVSRVLRDLRLFPDDSDEKSQ